MTMQYRLTRRRMINDYDSLQGITVLQLCYYRVTTYRSLVTILLGTTGELTGKLEPNQERITIFNLF